MSTIDYLPATCQVVHKFFCFKTLTAFTYIEFHRRMVEAIASREPFDGLELFPLLENESNPDREVADLVLDCEWTGKDRLRVEILPGLVELLKYVDPESIYIGVHGKVKGPGEPIYWADIDFIHVMYFVRNKCLPVIEDDRLKIRVPCGTESRDLPKGSRAQGSVTPEPEPDFIPGRKKGHLTVVKAVPEPKRKARKGKRPPKDIVKYFRKEEPALGWPAMLRAMYRESWWDRVKRRRIFNKGVEWLAERCGLSVTQVRRILLRMKVRRVETERGTRVKGIIKLRRRGWPGEGASPWELPCNMGLVMRWRRHLPKK